MATAGRPQAGERHIALFLPSLAGGGVARSFLQLARGFAARGHRVELVLCRATGPYLAQLEQDDLEVVELSPEPGWRARLRALSLSPEARAELLRPILLPWSIAPALPFLASFARYLERARPEVVLSGKTHTNLVAIWGRRLAQSQARIVVSERTNLTREIASSRKWRWRHVAPLVGKLYPAADAITSVSNGVSDDLAHATGLPRDSIRTIYNPVARPEIHESAKAEPEHPFFHDGGPPVVLAIGRLTEQKQLPVLLEAFARVRSRRPTRLVILGEGKLRAALEARVEALGLSDCVSLPGFSDNPYACLAGAAVFVLSSAWEGLPGVLIEALVCGCPVVSTDCPSGPREILADGKYGRLVPVGDVAALARAIEATLADPPERGPLRSRGAEFSLTASVEGYLEVLLPAAAAPRATG